MPVPQELFKQASLPAIDHTDCDMHNGWSWASLITSTCDDLCGVLLPWQEG
jgi:hypothetical protein